MKLNGGYESIPYTKDNCVKLKAWFHIIYIYHYFKIKNLNVYYVLLGTITSKLAINFIMFKDWFLLNTK